MKRTRYIIIFANSILIALLIFVIVHTAYLFLDDPSITVIQSTPPETPPSPPKLTTAKSWDIFGPPPQGTTKTSANHAEAGPNSIKLLGVFDNDRTGWAIFLLDESQYKLVHTGNTITGSVSLVSLHLNSATISDGNREYNIYIPKTEHLSDTITEAKSVTTAPPHNSHKAKTPREKVISMLNIEPVNPGSPDGYLVTSSSNLLIENYHLKDGDQIITVNGFPVGTESDDQLAFQAFQQSQSALIEVKRGQKIITREYIPE